MAELALEPRHFSIEGGPFATLLRRVHLARPDGSPRTWALVAIAWVPLFLGALLRVVYGGRPAPILYDISVHARLLVSIPLMLEGGHLFVQRTRGAIEQLYEGNFADRAALDRIVDRTERIRDSKLVMIAMLAIVVLAGVAVVAGVFGRATGILGGVEEGGTLSFARVWYALIALPMTQFFVVRWLWQWAIWSYILLRLARLKLALIPTHPDHAAGIGFLAGPIAPYSFLVCAGAVTISAGWATEIMHGATTLQACVPAAVAYVIFAVAVAIAPLFAYVPMLYRARHRTIRQYNGLALRYVRSFHHKWVEAPSGEPVLGTSDIQSLNDLIGAYGQLERVRPVPFGTRPILILWGAAIIPMAPLAFTAMPVTEVFQRLGKMLLGFVA